MQPGELRALRKGLGWTQQAMADALGITAPFLGQMERGAKPIERRTALAVRYLAAFPDAAHTI